MTLDSHDPRAPHLTLDSMARHEDPMCLATYLVLSPGPRFGPRSSPLSPNRINWALCISVVQ